MDLLAALGLTGPDARILLIDPPDGILAEAGRLKPRPAVASTLQVASPSPHIVWWPERRLLEPGPLSRLGWLLGASGGDAWLVIDAEDDLDPGEVREALAPAGLRVAEERTLGTTTALRVARRLQT